MTKKFICKLQGRSHFCLLCSDAASLFKAVPFLLLYLLDQFYSINSSFYAITNVSDKISSYLSKFYLILECSDLLYFDHMLNMFHTWKDRRNGITVFGLISLEAILEQFVQYNKILFRYCLPVIQTWICNFLRIHYSLRFFQRGWVSVYNTYVELFISQRVL